MSSSVLYSISQAFSDSIWNFKQSQSIGWGKLSDPQDQKDQNTVIQSPSAVPYSDSYAAW